MATFMTLPTELRLQIYRELFVSKPRIWRMGQQLRGPVTCYNGRTFHTAILGVSRKIYGEAKSVLYGDTTWTLHIYLIFIGSKIHGSDVDSALHSLSRSKEFRYVRACILDIRLFRGQEHSNRFMGDHVLRANIKTVRQALLRAPALRDIEVSWRNYFSLDPTETRCRSLEPLDQLHIKYKLSIAKVVNTLERSKSDLADWPEMLKAFRVLLFRGASGEQISC